MLAALSFGRSVPALSAIGTGLEPFAALLRLRRSIEPHWTSGFRV